MSIYFIIPIIIIVIIIVIVAFFFISKNLRRKKIAQELNLKLLSIRLQKTIESKKQQKDFKDEINISSQLFGILAGLKFPFIFEAAVPHVGEEIHFYVAVPKESVEFVSRQIEGLLENVQIEPIDDYNIFNSSGFFSGIYIKQKLSYALPIRSYIEANIDTFAPILSGLSKINEIGEGAAIQILAKSAPLSVKKTISKMIEMLKKGSKLNDILKGLKISLKDIKKALNVSENKNKEEKIIDEEAIKILQSKIEQPLLAVNLRILTSAPSQYQADEILESISGGFSQFSAPLRNEFKIIKPRNIKNLIYQFSFREFSDNQTIILNTKELASLFHLPSSSTEIPKIKWLKSKEAAPPANLPKSGILIGESVFRGEKKRVYLTEDDRRRHVYIIGQTGTGKSTLLINMVIEDIKNNKGVAILDPHGDLIEKILRFIPKERIEDILIFDPSDIENSLGMNMLEYDLNKPEQKTFIVNELFNILDKLYDLKTVGGPMFEQYTKNAILLLMEDMINEPATLMDIPKVFTDSDFRDKKLSRISNPVVIDFWQKEATKATGEHSLVNMAPYITSKFNNFIANDYIRPIINQAKSAFNFRQIMDEGKILLINLSKGRLGDINANLLGMIIIGKILMAALSRVDIPEESRRDFNFYIDEFQNFTTDSIETIFSEARKYRLNLSVAHQFIAQLTEKNRNAVFGNVGSIIAFRVGTTDAEFLVKQFEPVFNESDLVNIDNFNAYIKILISGKTSLPFNIKTIPPEKGNREIGEKIKELSRLKYSRNK